MTLLLRTGGSGEWHEPAITAYENEAHLQEIILGSPQLLPAVPTPAVTVAEFPTSEDCFLDILCVWWRPSSGVNGDGRRLLVDDVTRRV